MDTKALQRLYEDTFSKTYTETGPRLVAKKGKQGKYISLNRLFAAGEPLLAGVSFPTQHHQIVEVESPWHALCVAMVLQNYALTALDMHLLFRGQSNSSYELRASIFRPGADQPNLERAKKFLAWFLASNSGLKIADDPTLFYGAAQHYQIWTDLLDVTPDPAIAVWFASLPSREKHETASIFAIPFDAAERMGATLRLPPPYIERLHRQRGLFIQCKDATPLPLDEVIEIRFPQRRPSSKPFNVIRHGKIIEVLKDHSWIRKTVEWAKAAAKDNSIEVPTAVPTGLTKEFALFIKAAKIAGIPTNQVDRKKIQLSFYRWLDQFNDLLYWLAYRFDDRNKGNEELLEPQYVSRVVKHNPELARLYVDEGRRLGLDRPMSFHNQLDVVDRAIRQLRKP